MSTTWRARDNAHTDDPQVVDHSIARPYGVIEAVLVKVKQLVFPTDFVVIDIEEDADIPPFLASHSCLPQVAW